MPVPFCPHHPFWIPQIEPALSKRELLCSCLSASDNLTSGHRAFEKFDTSLLLQQGCWGSGTMHSLKGSKTMPLRAWEPETNFATKHSNTMVLWCTWSCCSKTKLSHVLLGKWQQCNMWRLPKNNCTRVPDAPRRSRHAPYEWRHADPEGMSAFLHSYARSAI